MNVIRLKPEFETNIEIYTTKIQRLRMIRSKYCFFVRSQMNVIRLKIKC